MSKIAAVATKTLRELTRDRKGFALTLGLPIVFMLVFGFAFGQDGGNATYDVAVVNQDGGVSGAPGGGFAFGANFTDTLANVTYDDGTRIFHVQRFDALDEARALVEDRDVDALVVIPPEFSNSLAGRGGAATVTIVGDPSYQAFNTANAIVANVLDAFAEQAAPSSGPRVRAATESVVSLDLAAFDFIAPGLMVFAILNLAPQAAAVLARERENHTLERLRLTRVGAPALLVGMSLAQMAIAAISLAAMIGTALLMGFQPQGSLPIAFLVVLVSALSVLGVGMVIAAFADKQDDAANIGVLFSVPASFLSGAFFPIPPVPLFELGGRVVQAYDILPSTHAVRALCEVLTLGNGLADVTWDIVALCVLTVLYFAAGAALYARRRLRFG